MTVARLVAYTYVVGVFHPGVFLIFRLNAVTYDGLDNSSATMHVTTFLALDRLFEPVFPVDFNSIRTQRRQCSFYDLLHHMMVT